MRKPVGRLGGSILAFAFFLTGCASNQGNAPNSAQSSPSTSPTPSRSTPEGALELVFPYGSEKEKWISDVTQTFNDSGRKTASGKRIFVKPIPLGSGETIDQIQSGELKAHLASPASLAFIKLGNAESRAKTGKDLIPSTENLVLSPVVIAMWKPMAEAIGWGKKPLGWSDILAIARNPKGWSAFGFPQWGDFKFGHTHPLYSNSGLISVLAEAYAALGKTKDLTVADVESPKTRNFVSAIQSSVVHYGSSTGFFGRKMFENGPQYLSAAVLYESMVVESYDSKAPLAFPVVAIYPREGTFWSDHPVGIVDRDWVTPEHREAAKIYISWLLEKPQQQKALIYGFRPASVDVPVTGPIDAAHGVDPAQPKTTLEVPPVPVIDAALKMFSVARKSSDVVLVLDTSGSMEDNGKLVNAKAGARQLLEMLGDDDTFSLLPFSNQFAWAATDISMKKGRADAIMKLDSLFAHGGTALYDAISEGYDHLLARKGGKKIQAVVVLTDGADNQSQTKIETLLEKVRLDGENHTIRIFTIAYGGDARKDILKQIADATQAKAYEGNPKNIADVFRDISTFF